MSMPDQLDADWTRILQDWGQLVSYRVVSTERNLETGGWSETCEDSPLLALAGGSQEVPDRRAGGQSLQSEMEFVARTRDLPRDAPQLTDRILVADQEYQIVAFQQLSRGEMTALRLARR